MEDNITKAIALLRPTASDLQNGSSNSTTTTTPTTASSVSEIRRLFSPYQKTKRALQLSKRRPEMKWSHKFCCLSDPNQDYLPNKDMKNNLFAAGLGERRLVMDKCNDAEAFSAVLYGAFPKLIHGGGFEILKSANRYCMEVVKPSKVGYTSEYLADSCSLGQSIVFIRPLQRELDIESVEEVEPSENCPKEECVICGELMPVINIKAHISEFHKGQEGKRKRIVDTPICKYTCLSTDAESSKIGDCLASTSKQKACIPPDMQECPICFNSFPIEEIELHSSLCSEKQSDELNSFKKTFDDELAVFTTKICNEKWKLSVVRSNFYDTTVDQLQEASSDDWYKPIMVNFIGEEGVDHGGLTPRIFFSLVFIFTNI